MGLRRSQVSIQRRTRIYNASLCFRSSSMAATPRDCSEVDAEDDFRISQTAAARPAWNEVAEPHLQRGPVSGHRDHAAARDHPTKSAPAARARAEVAERDSRRRRQWTSTCRQDAADEGSPRTCLPTVLDKDLRALGGWRFHRMADLEALRGMAGDRDAWRNLVNADLTDQ